MFCGLGGWTEALLAEGYRVIGFDIERHEYGEHRYPGQLVLQDVLTLHGRQLKDATLIVASPPCQEYSYMAMPWSKAKAKAAAIKADKSGAERERLNRLFNACFRIQREACEAAGRHIPMIVENVRGAIPWVGRSRWNFGSFHLWGDVPALMPIPAKRTALKVGVAHRSNGATNFYGHKNPGFRFDGSGASFQSESVKNSGVKSPGLDWNDRTRKGQAFNSAAQGRAFREALGHKNGGGSWFNVANNTTSGKGQNPDGRKVPSLGGGRRTDPGRGARLTSRDCDGIKCGGDWFNAEAASFPRKTGSKSSARKAASALIAKIPQPLARHIARHFYPW